MKTGALLSAKQEEGEKSKEFGLLDLKLSDSQPAHRGVLDESLSSGNNADEMYALLGFFTGLSTLEAETNAPSRNIGSRSFSAMVRASKRRRPLISSRGHTNTPGN